MKKNLRFVFCLLLLLAACGSQPDLKPGSPINLASFTENSVTVTLSLELDSAGQAWLAATFTPDDPEGHVYSKDIPRDGVDGLGRPTLLELAPGSRMQAAGPLAESVPATETDLEGLLVYPAGAVTLRLPVSLPPGNGWIEESISVTYMACGSGSCWPPVIGKIVLVRVPGADAILKP
ncbi:MAG: hypothetical protein FD146_2625 [Anaerolineaceae bacterium]|nr:MAG: hypothetical protein FD146_2625 [Anaerolineaceae bacterium]